MPITADGDERVLQRARDLRAGYDGVEGLLQPLVPAADLLAYGVQLVAGGVFQLARGRDLAVQKADQVAEIGKIPRACPQACEVGARLRQRGLQRPSGFHDHNKVEHLERR